MYWGGSSGEGIIVPPSPDVTDMGHTNGVPVLGTVFFPQNVSGGKVEWLDQTLAQKSDGSFPVADKLIEVATTYGFDGWFINQETEVRMKPRWEPTTRRRCRRSSPTSKQAPDPCRVRLDDQGRLNRLANAHPPMKTRCT
ncbi:MAG: endo-beta-N-acetylglucosaminidase [Bifidobacterium breve]